MLGIELPQQPLPVAPFDAHTGIELEATVAFAVAQGLAFVLGQKAGVGRIKRCIIGNSWE